MEIGLVDGRQLQGEQVLTEGKELAEGYTKTFGLVHVDFATQKRTPKLSYDWYRDVIRRRMVL